MAESQDHARLVNALMNWVVDQYFQGDTGNVLTDNPSATAVTKPPKTNGFIPDLFARQTSGMGVIIGEAKTAIDLENLHSESQISSFIKKCAEDSNSVFVLAVPWYMERSATSLVRFIQRRDGTQNVEIVVLPKLEG